MRLTTEGRIAAGGEALARAPDGRVVFVEGAAPEETVEAELYETKKRFARARVLSVLQPGPDRIEPECPHYGVCGGCTLQHLPSHVQARLKTEAARATLSRIGGVEPEEVEATWFGPAYGTRSRVRWMSIPGPSGVDLGYRARRSHRGVPVRQCPVLELELQAALPVLREHLSDDPPHEIWAVTDGRAVSTSLSTPPPGLTSGAMPVTDRAGTRWVAPQSFSQNHRAGNDALIETIQRWIRPGAQALELYAGSGNFTRVLEAKVSESVVAVESDRAAVRLARRIRGPRTRLLERPVEQVSVAGNWDLVLVDPPRTGLPATLCNRLGGAPGVLIYVSCDPGTFARDAERLTKAGRRLRRFRAFDLYPQTGHLEILGEFLPAEARS